jgi:hypothetical protein
MDQSPSILSAQYGNKLISPGELGKIRGSGKFSTKSPLSSNYQLNSVSLWNPEIKFPNYGKNWTTTEVAPVGTRVNDQWVFEEEKTSLKGDPYTQFALNSTHQAPNSLLNTFFSRPNVKYLGRRLVEEVKRITGHDIKEQSEDALLVIMREKYQYAQVGSLPQPSFPNMAHSQGAVNISLVDRITRLNQAVLQTCVKSVVSGVSMYKQYYKDASSVPVPLSRPTYMGNKGGKVLQENIGMHSGNSKGIQSYNLRNNVIN